jgi:carboxymethylenebutenolidase
MEKVTIETADGACPSYVFRPEGAGAGPWPAVLVFMDGIGIRPAMLEIADRIGKHGYVALLPDLYYRGGPYEPLDAKGVFTDPELRKMLMERFIPLAKPALAMADTRAFLDYLASRPDVEPGGVGATGYCMGGRLALTAAGTYPDHIIAAASYHGGPLASDAPESPHRLATTTKARVYVGFPPDDLPGDMRARLEEAFTNAGVAHTIEKYDAKHGWVPRDTPVHDAAAAERHWQTLFALLDGTLKNR